MHHSRERCASTGHILDMICNNRDKASISSPYSGHKDGLIIVDIMKGISSLHVLLYFRDLFYSTLLRQINSGRISIQSADRNTIARIIALVAQITYGDFHADSLPEYSTLVTLKTLQWTTELQKLVETQHLSLDLIMSSEAKIEFITLVSEFGDYGVEKFQVYSSVKKNDELLLCVRQDGLSIYNRDEATKGTEKTEESQLVQL